MKQLTTAQLREWMKSSKEFMLVDVREPLEREAFSIGGSLIPLGEIMSAQGSLRKDMPVVLYCEKGIRSAIAIQRLEALGFENLYNLTGGMKAWRSAQR